MESRIKEVIAGFIKIPADQIGVETPIGRQAVKSSILLHRMYARLAEQGIVIANYADVRVFGDLLMQISEAGAAAVVGKAVVGKAGVGLEVNGGGGDPAGGDEAAVRVPPREVPPFVDESGSGIGIDIEAVGSMPVAGDFRKDAFYTMNFSAEEMAYCILQSDPYASFAGLFAAKEAIVKADTGGRYRTAIFNTIIIGHTAAGKPVHPGFELSISHAGGMAVAVAVTVKEAPAGVQPVAASAVPTVSTGGGKGAVLLGWLSFVLAIIALIVTLTR